MTSPLDVVSYLLRNSSFPSGDPRIPVIKRDFLAPVVVFAFDMSPLIHFDEVCRP